MISQTAEYALRAMTFLAMRDRAATGHEVAAVTRVPAGYLAKIMQQLVKAKLVRSQRGMGGGFVLSGDTDEISLLDVMNAVDPVENIKSCPLAIQSHGSNLCPLHKRLSQAVNDLQCAFKNATLSELVEEAKKPDCRSVPLIPEELRAEYGFNSSGS